MNLVDKQKLFARNFAQLIEYIYSKGYACTLGETARTSEQAALYAQQNKGIVDSLHCKRLAADINLFDGHGNYLSDTNSYRFLGEYWEALHPHNRWGGIFKRADGNHFEMQDI